MSVSFYEGQGINPALAVAEGLAANIAARLMYYSLKVGTEFGPRSCTLCLLLTVTAPDRRLHFTVQCAPTWPRMANILMACL